MKNLTKFDELKIVKKYLGNLKFLRSFVKDADLDFLEKALYNFKNLLEEKKEAIEIEKLEIEELEKKRQQLLSDISNAGWTIDSILNPVTRNTLINKKSKKEPKYQFTDDKGKNKTWSGHGKMPFALKKQIDQGKSLEEFLIKK